jgi:hypothetical protein
MPSPFSGMNPYLEQASVWHDFHMRFIARIANELTPMIRPKYHAKIDHNIYIHELSAEERYLLGRPDVAVLSTSRPAGVATTAMHREAPVYGHVQPATDILREPFIEIRDNESRELVAAIEVLSPANKSIGADREQYIAKRRKLLSGSTHLVEIDLLRGGPRMPIEKLPQCDYVVMVGRSDEHPRVGLWPVRLKERLPEIPIPLRIGDPDVLLDLQPVVHSIYDAAGYEDYIYSGRPSPPLHPEDAKWAEEIIAAQVRAT